MKNQNGGQQQQQQLIPEHVDLGLRLTVGEDVVQKPSLPSMQGAGGHFPESSPYTEPAFNAYFPATGGSGAAAIPGRLAAYLAS